MILDAEILTKLMGPSLATVVAVGLKFWSTGRPKLIAFIGHSSAHAVQETEKSFRVHTHALVLKNNGNKRATNVRLGHRIMPQHVTVHPTCTASNNSGGG
jgi:hypothetical protein